MKPMEIILSNNLISLELFNAMNRYEVSIDD